MSAFQRKVNYAGLFLCILAPTVVADLRFSETHVVRGRWTYTPVMNEFNTVEVFLALATPGSTSGENFNAMWISRESSSSQQFSRAEAWYLGDQILAARSVAMLEGIEPASLVNLPFELGAVVLSGEEIELPAEVNRGLLADDPLQAVLDTVDNPTEAVDELVSFGYAAARLGDGGGETGVPPEDGCEIWMAILAQMLEDIANGIDPQSASASAASQMSNSCNGYCIPWVVPDAPGPWTTTWASGWALYASSTTSNSFQCEYARSVIQIQSAIDIVTDIYCATWPCTRDRFRAAVESGSCFPLLGHAEPRRPVPLLLRARLELRLLRGSRAYFEA